MAFVDVGGVRLAYHEAGNGPHTFVFIHGWACDRSFWKPQFDDLSRDYRCIAVDLRGRGDSAAIPPYDTTTAADDAAALIDSVGGGPCIVVGHSLGGLVALLLNDRRADLVKGIVLGDSPLTSAAGDGFGGMVDAIRKAGSMAPAAGFVDSFFVESTPAAVKEHAREVMLGCPADVGAGMLDNATIFQERMVDLIKAADAKPFMAIWAEHPLGNPDRLRDVTTFLRQEPIAGAGHFFELEQPAITNALLRAFVDDVERDPRL